MNFLGNEDEERVRAAYGAQKFERLVALKNKYDPTNLFRLNQNIKRRSDAAHAEPTKDRWDRPGGDRPASSRSPPRQN